MKSPALPLLACLLSACAARPGAAAPEPVPAASYAIVVSRATAADPAFGPVVAALEERHPGAQVVLWGGGVAEAKAGLAARMPRHTAFVATPKEASRAFVADVGRLCRALDADPYTDTCWGIVTGFDAANALEMARFPGLTIHQVGSGTAFATRCVERGVWYDELKAGLQVEKKADGTVERRQGPRDSTALVADAFSGSELFITSSHGSERSWQLGHVYRNGFFRSKAGDLYATDSDGKKVEVASTREKAWMPVGNCLVGHIDGPDAFMLAMLKDGKVRAAAAYTVPTWYGYAGWGLLDYFVEQPSRYTYAEAVLANRLALEQRLYAAYPQAAALAPEPGGQAAPGPAAPGATLGEMDGVGLLHDRDVLAFYGDPAAEVRMADGWKAYGQALKVEPAGSGRVRCTLTIEPLAGAESFATVDRNGSQRGGRPIVAFLPRRIDPKTVQVETGADRRPLVGDDFVLVPRPDKADGAFKVVWTAGE